MEGPNEKPPRVFVAGATGLTGREVVASCCARDLETVAHVRPDSSALRRWTERFEALGARVDATPWAEDALTETLASLQPTHVFALLGTTKARGRAAASQGQRETYETVDYGLSAMLIRAVVASGAGARVVYLSSMGVSPTTGNAYLAVRHRVEQELAATGLSYLIARPSFILGERDQPRPLERIGASVADGLLGLAGALGASTLRERYRSQTAPQLARALIRAALDEQASRTIESGELRALGTS